MKALLTPSLNWMLVFLPAAIALRYFFPGHDTAVFICSALAIVPLAGWLGDATEHLASRAGPAVGGLLNATFGNAAELIIAVMALRDGLAPIVKASLTGSIIGNVLLVFGAAVVAGGVRHKTQQFNARGARVQSTMLSLAAIGLVAPAAYHYLAGPAGRLRENDLSLEISIVLLVTYALGLLFTLRTHRQFFVSAAAGDAPEPEHAGPQWSTGRSLTVLAAATALIAWVSEILVGSVEHAAHTFGMTNLFIGVVVVAIIGNAAEHSTAVTVAVKNRMDLALGIAIGSSIQVALFVAPALVLASYFIAPRPMDLVFTPVEVMAVVVAVAVVWQIADDGECNWLEGVQLLAVYVILGLLFYFLPEAAASHATLWVR
jgi:Ca2+:H+ antiporter